MQVGRHYFFFFAGRLLIEQAIDQHLRMSLHFLFVMLIVMVSDSRENER